MDELLDKVIEKKKVPIAYLCLCLVPGNTQCLRFFSSGLFTLIKHNSSMFGQNTSNTAGSGGGLFGAAGNNTASASNNATSGGLFGAKPASSGAPFGGNNASQPASGGLFGANNASQSTSGGLFGSNSATNNSTGSGLFGSAAPASNTNSGGLFGNKPAPTTGGNTSSGGLFGNNSNNSTSTPFGGSNTAATSSGGLFGANANKPAASGGLFGGGNTSTNTAPASGGLFGGNSNTSSNPAPPAGGLFGGNSNTSSNPAPATGGLFGNNPKPANNTASAPGGLFGANNANAAAPATGGLFGNNSNNNTTSSTSGGLLGGTQSASNAQNQTQPNSAPVIPSANTQAANLSSNLTKSDSKNLLKDLLESAQNLPKPDNLQLGSIHLTLNELQNKSEKLRKTNKDANFTKAHYLLAASGINAEDIEMELNSIELPAPSKAAHSRKYQQSYANSAAAASNSNLESYLSSKKHENILNTIEQSLSLASADFDNYISSNISIDWKARRDELRKSIGLSGNSSTSSDLKRSITWNLSVPGNFSLLTPLNSKDSDALGNNFSALKQLSRDKFENHAKIVYQLNEARLNNNNFPLALNFGELSKFQNDLKSKQISGAWKVLIELTDEKFAKINQEQKFHESHHNSLSLSKSIVNSSRSFLETEFFNYIEEIYLKDNKRPLEFSPATNVNKVSYFINKIILKNESDFLSKTLYVNGTPVWALVFYLMRAGLYREALELTAKNSELFNKFDSNFAVYLKSFVENENHNLPSELNKRLHNEFNQQFQFVLSDLNNTSSGVNFDPYKYAVYKIIGKCDLSRKSLPPAINLSIEDWIWFHLSIINEFQFNNESALVFENYSLHNLQSKVTSLGPKYFNKSSNNPLYLKTLVLMGLYELAVQYAYDFINECDAVHLAIGFNYYGLLKVSSFHRNDLLIMNGNEQEINFSRLLGSYTRTFKVSDPKVACQYLILITLSKGGNSKEETSKCHEALRELILISREFSMLLGSLDQSNGTKTPGILEKQRKLINLDNLSEFCHQIIEISATKCQEEGRIFDALLLYQLCLEYDIVVSLLNRLLAELLALTDLDKPIVRYGNYELFSSSSADSKDIPDTIDNNIILLAKHLMKVFNNNSSILSKISSQKKTTCDLLLRIIDVRDSFLEKDWQNVLSSINKLGLIPVDANDDLIKIRTLSELIHGNNLDDSLIKVVPSLLIMAMTSLSQLNYAILTRKYQGLGNEREELQRLKQISKNCMIYAGMVQYKMPRETYSLLISLESLL